MEAGQEFGGYTLVSRIGAGGMGEVWKAEDPRLRRVVAIKILPLDSAADSESNARFMREARTAAQLYHPNIATIHSIEEHDGRLFIVMEYVEGEPLSQAIRSGRLGEAEVAFIGKGVADALAEAHANGIVHRDIKPDNVILSGQKVKVLDFGIAKKYQTQEEASDDGATFTDFRTQRGVILGTIQYMSPEQAMGKALDGRSDIFSLGVVLYEAATGRLPFKGETATDTLTRIIRDEAPDLRATHPNLSPVLTRTVMKCLAKERDDRYQKAAELSKDLEAIFQGSRTGRRAVMADAPTAISEPVGDVAPVESDATPKAPITARTGPRSASGPGPWPWIFATVLVAAISIAGTAWYLTRVAGPPAAASSSPESAPAEAITVEDSSGPEASDSAATAIEDAPEMKVVDLDPTKVLPPEPPAETKPDETARPDNTQPLPRLGVEGGGDERGSFQPRSARDRVPAEPAENAPRGVAAEAYLRRGLWLIAHGHESEGARALRTAVELNPRMARAYLPLGALSLRANRKTEAAKAFGEALKHSESLGGRELDFATFGRAVAVGDVERLNELCKSVPFEGEFGELRSLAKRAGADCAVPVGTTQPIGRSGPRRGDRPPPPPRPRP